MARYPQIAIDVIRIIGKRLQEIQDRVRELATQRADRRVVHALLRLARQASHSTADGTAIEFPLRRKDVVDISGNDAAHCESHLTIRQPAVILRIAEDAVD